jgi:hypothetical protein
MKTYGGAEVRGQLHVPAALAAGKDPCSTHWVWTLCNREVYRTPAGNRTPAVQPVASRCTD